MLCYTSGHPNPMGEQMLVGSVPFHRKDTIVDKKERVRQGIIGISAGGTKDAHRKLYSKIVI